MVKSWEEEGGRHSEHSVSSVGYISTFSPKDHSFAIFHVQVMIHLDRWREGILSPDMFGLSIEILSGLDYHPDKSNKMFEVEVP